MSVLSDIGALAAVLNDEADRANRKFLESEAALRESGAGPFDWEDGEAPLSFRRHAGTLKICVYVDGEYVVHNELRRAVRIDAARHVDEFLVAMLASLRSELDELDLTVKEEK